MWGIRKSLFFLLGVSIFSTGCFSNYLKSTPTKVSLLDIIDEKETTAVSALLSSSAEEIFAAARRVFSSKEISILFLQKSHSRRTPLQFRNASSYDTSKPGVVAAVVRRDSSYENFGVIYIYPRGTHTEVKTFARNIYRSLFATTSELLFRSLKRTLILNTNKPYP